MSYWCDRRQAYVRVPGADGFVDTLRFWIIMPYGAVTFWALLVAAALKARRSKSRASAGNIDRCP